ncbi:glycoside hydrolase family 5 protein [Vibrio sp. SM6]|uniref:Glycoside hydrolase family 5 protein n=1 Tax=Vibrio agarilyticus TaxID=2726741 RepID=A0A7X8YGB7_9VIBR|nr:cellulase family glycosylhydrolase [Vibrio agarilyticus]NLS12519.1 glycoside hydrolase family 5 protein [Vibrio agarilyticus]
MKRLTSAILTSLAVISASASISAVASIEPIPYQPFEAPKGEGTSKPYLTYQGKNVYLNAVNIAWIDYGRDFGNGLNESRVTEIFDDIAKNGGNAVRWWIHVNGTQTPAWDGKLIAPASQQKQTFDDIERALDLAAERGLYIMPTLWSFDMLSINQYGVKEVAGNNFAFLTNDEVRQSYIDNFLNPLLDRIAGHPALIAIDLFNEPENMTEGWFIERENLKGQYPVTYEDIHKTTAILSAAVHKKAKALNKQIMTTTGSKSLVMFMVDGHGGTNYYSDERMIAYAGDDAPLDFYAPHYYDDMDKKGTWSPFYHHASFWNLDKPIVMGEYYVDPHGFKPADFAYFDNEVGQQNLCPRLVHNGYAGGMAWQIFDYQDKALDCINKGAQALGVKVEDFVYPGMTYLNGMKLSSDFGKSKYLNQSEATDNLVALSINEPAGEKKVYFKLPVDKAEGAKKVSFKVKFPQAARDAKITGGKFYMKDAKWQWNDAKWTNIKPNEWKTVTWKMKKPLKGANELGFQFYGKAEGGAFQGEFLIDDIKFSK